MTRDLTIVMPHFCNLGMFAEQQRVWCDYPDDLRARLHVVVVDDCSPKGERPSRKSVAVDGLASLRIFRLLEKKRWNWLACRNLGAKATPTHWLLLTDMDHVVPVETLRRLLDGPLDPGNAYRFKRVTATRTWPYPLSACTEYKAHNDTWLMTRSMFFSDRIGGYDERLSGCYGTSGEFRDRVLSAVKAHVILNDVVIRYPREVIPDASTLPSTYTRKNDASNDRDLQQRKEARAKVPGWKPLRGLIDHEEVFSSLSTTEVA